MLDTVFIALCISLASELLPFFFHSFPPVLFVFTSSFFSRPVMYGRVLQYMVLSEHRFLVCTLLLENKLHKHFSNGASVSRPGVQNFNFPLLA